MTTNEAPISAFLLLLIAAVGLTLIIGGWIEKRQAQDIAERAAARAEASAQTLARMPLPKNLCGTVRPGETTCVNTDLGPLLPAMPVVGEVER